MPSPLTWSALDFVVLDVEGNGQQPPELVELALVPVVGGVIGEPVSWLVRPSRPITWQARKVHGIEASDVAGSPAFPEVAHDVLRALGDAVPVGHNVRVDLRVLGAQLPEWQPAEAIDTLRMARATWNVSSYALGALVTHRALGNALPEHLRPHRAAYDALVTARLLVDLCSSVEPLTVEELRKRGGISLREAQLDLFG